MASRHLSRALQSATKPMSSIISHSYTTAAIPRSSLSRLRPVIAAATAAYVRRLAPSVFTRAFATRQTSSSLNNPSPNWSNRPPKETSLLDGCDFEHWLVVMEKPEPDATRDEIIDSYIKTLAMVVGSEEEARMKIYSVSTRHYYAFGALVPEELTYKIKECPRVTWVLPDSYLDPEKKEYGGEPFINGQAVPYDPKHHEEWLTNNGGAKNKPKFENRRVSRPSKTIKDDSALESQPKGGEWINEFKSCVDKLVKVTNSEIEAGSPDYSISAALKCLDEMEDFPESDEMYLDACEVLKDDGNRELFMSLAPEMRRKWLQRALDRGVVEFFWDADERERFASLPPEQQRRWVMHRHPVSQP